MKILRRDANWYSYTTAQKIQITQWLFHQMRSYRETRELMLSELGLRCSVSSIALVRRHLLRCKAWLVLADPSTAGEPSATDVGLKKSHDEYLENRRDVIGNYF